MESGNLPVILDSFRTSNSKGKSSSPYFLYRANGNPSVPGEESFVHPIAVSLNSSIVIGASSICICPSSNLGNFSGPSYWF
ncbi:hypothetical protein GDO81_008242 [Engystomops pustulosus]|uniref:Uncharacterized protein n=1 Tax=Engystomops pustulosus TaxID=76066 RepID=A0AAV7CD75_ENGPU|nr:hypothetical protein GDO81_008242 [Engystomops pustulosus]